MNLDSIYTLIGIIVVAGGLLLGAEARYAPASLSATVQRIDLENQLRALQFQYLLEKCTKHDQRSFCVWLRQEIARVKMQMGKN